MLQWGSQILPIRLPPTESNRTFANGESPQDALARVQWTFVNRRKSDDALAKLQWTFANWRKSTGVLYWRKYSGLSPIWRMTTELSPIWRMSTELSQHILWTFVIGECPVSESPICEIRVSRYN